MLSDGNLNLTFCSPEEWGTVRKAIQRDPTDRSDFVHFDFAGTDVPLGATTNVVITTASVGLPVGSKDSLRLIRDLVQALPFDRGRLSGSAAWEKRRTKPGKSGVWRKVTFMSAPLEESAAGARAMGLTPTPIKPLKGKDSMPWAYGYEVSIPTEVLSDEIDGWLTMQMMFAGTHVDNR
jgi:hypothetical protein